jgi:hypothetical protein
MGLDSAALTFLCYSKKIGVDFSSTITLGRQGLFPSVKACQRVFKSLNIRRNPIDFLVENSFAESFFHELGAQTVDSIDFSGYEGSTIQKDLNIPIDNALKNAFSAVYDGGTLEHVFNIPQAFKNCMEMVAVGGHFLQCTVANNFLGHGFWQISPELIFRIFSTENGFQIEKVLLFEFGGKGKWFSVLDPDQVKSRVLLCNSRPTYIFTLAKKISDVPVFQTNPYQSDYSIAWMQAAHNTFDKSEATRSRTGVINQRAPSLLRRVYRKIFRVFCQYREAKKIHANVRRNLPPIKKFSEDYFRRIPEAFLLSGRS